MKLYKVVFPTGGGYGDTLWLVSCAGRNDACRTVANTASNLPICRAKKYLKLKREHYIRLNGKAGEADFERMRYKIVPMES